jgi:hypothetical protein
MQSVLKASGYGGAVYWKRCWGLSPFCSSSSRTRVSLVYHILLTGYKYNMDFVWKYTDNLHTPVKLTSAVPYNAHRNVLLHYD